MEEEKGLTKQDLINDMYKDYNTKRASQPSLMKMNKKRFRQFILSNETAFDAAYNRWVGNGYSAQTKPTLIIPDLDGSLANDPNFNKMFEKMITDKGMQNEPTVVLEALRKNIILSVDNMKKGESYQKLMQEIFETYKAKGNEDNSK